MTTPVNILGSTGSVGLSTLDVIAHHPDRFRVRGLSAFSNVETMLGQVRRFQPEYVVMVDADSASELERKVKSEGLRTTVSSGEKELVNLAGTEQTTVVCGIVGAAGLLSVIAATGAGNRVLVANKEPLVMMGGYIVELAKRNGACLLPLDSEHNAIFQCLPQGRIERENGNASITSDLGIRQILLTGSGGPFRTLDRSLLATVTPEQACTHPNWSMGKKISVDSATMMNKGLELIEACALFSVPPSLVEIVIHPQSIIHSMVEYVDGSILAQMGTPDMRVPIANALGWPIRIQSGADRLKVTDIARIDFEEPDPERFPALRIARFAAEQGGIHPVVMNAANEIAVDAFLSGRIKFDKIPVIVETAMELSGDAATESVDEVLEIDRIARSTAKRLVSQQEDAA